MNKHLIPAFLCIFSTIQGQAQFKFGVAGGYDNTTVSTPWMSLKPGAFTYAFLTTTPIGKNLELHIDLDIANWSTSYTVTEPGAPSGYPIYVPPIYYQTAVKISHIVFPVSICRIFPVKHACFFAGGGLFLSNTRYNNPSSSMTCFGATFTGGLRLNWGLVLIAEFRPFFSGSGEAYSAPPETYPIEKVQNDFSLKLGYQFWKKKHQS